MMIITDNDTLGRNTTTVNFTYLVEKIERWAMVQSSRGQALKDNGKNTFIPDPERNIRIDRMNNNIFMDLVNNWDDEIRGWLEIQATDYVIEISFGYNDEDDLNQTYTLVNDDNTQDMEISAVQFINDTFRDYEYMGAPFFKSGYHY